MYSNTLTGPKSSEPPTGTGLIWHKACNKWVEEWEVAESGPAQNILDPIYISIYSRPTCDAIDQNAS